MGWYSTGDGVVPTDALIHEFYKGEASNAIHVTLDVNFANKGSLVRAWTGASLSLGPPAEDKTPTAIHFQELGVECRFQEEQRIGIDLLKKTETDKISTEAEGLDETVEKIGRAHSVPPCVRNNTTGSCVIGPPALYVSYK